MEHNELTVIAPINIALIKYWGKRDMEKILPLNDSVSININSVYAKTKVAITTAEKTDRVVVNGKELDLNGRTRFAQCFNRVRQLASGQLANSTVFRIESETNFPISAGLASSAAGFAAIAFGLGKLLDLDIDKISELARNGSGSACRSVYGGFVQWISGENSDGSDCFCRQLSSSDHWSNLRAIVVVTSSRVKSAGSTEGMQRTAETSQLLKHRLTLIPEKVRLLKDAILNKNFHQMAEIAMKDSNQLHAVCLDTYPPLSYLSESSCHLIELVHAFNDTHNRNKVAYTFDAGPNCCLLMEEQTVKEFLPYLCYFFPNSKEDKFIRGTTAPEIDRNIRPLFNSDRSENTTRLEKLSPMPDTVEYVIVSKLGAPPHVLGI